MCSTDAHKTKVIIAPPIKRKVLESFKFASGDLDVRPKMPKTKKSGPKLAHVGNKIARRLCMGSGIVGVNLWCQKWLFVISIIRPFFRRGFFDGGCLYQIQKLRIFHPTRRTNTRFGGSVA